MYAKNMNYKIVQQKIFCFLPDNGFSAKARSG